MLEINKILDTKKSRMSFVKGLIYIAKADGNVDETEKQFFTNAMIALELNNEDISKLQEILNSPKDIIDLEFGSRKQELFFFREAIQLCYIDKDYSEQERNLIENMRSKTDVTKEDIFKIESWVKEGIAWSLRGEKLLEMEAE